MLLFQWHPPDQQYCQQCGVAEAVALGCPTALLQVHYFFRCCGPLLCGNFGYRVSGSAQLPLECQTFFALSSYYSTNDTRCLLCPQHLLLDYPAPQSLGSG